MFSNAKKETPVEEFSNSSNIIGKGTSLKGHLNTAGNLRVEGKVEGSIHTKSKVVLGDTSVVEGNIFAHHAEVGGKVQGTLQISGSLILKPTAVVHGDIITSKLVFEEGAKFDGKCDMSGTVKEIKLAQPQSPAPKKNGEPLESTPQQAKLSSKRGKASA